MTAPLDGYTVPLIGAALPVAPMRPLRTPAVVASVGVAASALISAASGVLKAAGVDLGTPTAPAGPLVWFFLLGTPILIVAFVATASWLYRAQLNVHLLPDAHPRWTSGWAIVGWFVPVANLVLVPLVTADAARNTVPPQDHGKRRMLTALVVVWWLGFGGDTLVNALANLPQLDGVALQVAWFSLVLRVLSAPALIVLVLWLTRLQEARFAQGVAAPPTVIPAVPAPAAVIPAPPAPATPPLKASGAPALRSAVPQNDR